MFCLKTDVLENMKEEKNRAGVRDNKHVRFLVDVELLL